MLKNTILRTPHRTIYPKACLIVKLETQIKITNNNI